MGHAGLGRPVFGRRIAAATRTTGCPNLRWLFGVSLLSAASAASWKVSEQWFNHILEFSFFFHCAAASSITGSSSMRGWTALLIILWIIRLCWGHFCRVCTIHQGCMESADSSRYRRGFSTRSGIVLAAMRISGMRVPDGRKRLWKRRHGRRSLSHYFSLFIRYLWTVLRYLHLLVVIAGMVFSAMRICDMRVSAGRKRLRKRKSRKRDLRFSLLRLFQ